MNFAIVILTIIVLFMLAGVLPAQGGGQEVIFKTPVFMLLLGILSGALLLCSIRRRYSLKQLGFYLGHLAIVAIVIGAGIGYITGKKIESAMPVSAKHEIHELRATDGTTLPLNFGVTVTGFTVEYYAPTYYLYCPVTNSSGDSGYDFAEKVRVREDEPMVLKNEYRMSAERLKDNRGKWTEQLFLENGWVLQKQPPMARHYSAKMSFTSADGKKTEAEMAVNHPVSYEGWRFYLMSYDQQNERYIVVSARRDPGRMVVVSGLWALIAGIALLCFREKGVKGYAA